MLFLLWTDPYFGFIALGNIIFALSFHECAHAWIASLLGDNTAKNEGRITLNPCVQFEWYGFLLMLILGYGWAKPVTFNPENLKNPDRGEAIISLAGPASHVVLASLFTLAFHFLDSEVIFIGLYINFFLAFLNMMPLYPLDGEKVLAYLSPKGLGNFLKSIRYISYFSLLILVGFSVVFQVNLFSSVIDPLVSSIIAILTGF